MSTETKKKSCFVLTITKLTTSCQLSFVHKQHDDDFDSVGSKLKSGYHPKLTKSQGINKKIGFFFKNIYLPVMAKNKESSEHGSLSNPIERPNKPIVEVSSSSS